MGFASLFMDMSSELVHSLLPVFMVTTLGASMVTVGLLEGIAEATAAFAKVFAGALSDALGRRKPLMLLGYGLSAVTKPLFPLAGSVVAVFTARFLDRVGKGVRGAPRDALIAEITAPAVRGAAYGLRQALDSVGAFLGPLLAVVLLAVFAGNMRMAMWVAVIPAGLCVALLAVYVREPERAAVVNARPTLLAGARRLPSRYWVVVVFGAVFSLARFSEAFLLIRATDVGLTVVYVPLVLIVMNVCYSGAAFPAGVAADRLSHHALLHLGLGLLIAADIVLAWASSPAMVLAGAALWGLHMAATQGLLSKLVADAAPADLLGTGFGLFHLVGGVAMLLASLIAGFLWNAYGASATFVAGAAFAATASVGLVALRPRA